MKRQRSHFLEAPSRRGSALLAVLVIVAMLSLAAYTYSQLMLSEYEAAIRTGRIAETRMYAESGVEYALALVSLKNSEEPPDLFNNPDELHLVLVQAGTGERPAGYFSIVVPVSDASGESNIRYGFRNESAKINLNALAESSLSEDDARLFLMGIPYMTEATADSILDWIDANEDTRFYGVEAPFYEQIYAAQTPKNAPLQSIDELLAVDGVTADLLYGEDTNRNGILDANEDDGAESEPYDNADGVLDTGWVDYLTVTARESNLRLDGSTKIPLNTNTLTDLYDQLDEEFGEEIATFIVAYRLFGPVEPAELETPAGMSGGDTSSLTTDEQDAISNVTNAIASAFSGGGQVTRNGMDLSAGGSFEIRSLYDLVDVEVEAQFEDGPRTLGSPWSSAGGTLAKSFPEMNEAFGITTDTYIEGRINVNEARVETLMGIPTMTEDIADAIVAASRQMASGNPDADLVASRSTNCWLLTEGIVDLETMRQLDPYVTGGGDVLSCQVIGYLGSSGISSRLHIVIDASESLPKLLSMTDLSELGSGYTLYDWQQNVAP